VNSLREGSATLETIPGVVPNLLRLPAGCSFSLRCGQCGANCEKNMPELLETEPDHRVRCFLTEKEDAE
jgi:oligopeptide/dipeptide ABC transporter ATP-binding protein